MTIDFSKAFHTVSHPQLISQISSLSPPQPPPVLVDEGYMYGYVYFRQVKDKSLKRGYFQKSVVLLSVLPLVGLFTRVLEVLAPEYFDCGPASIEAACHNIDQWPPPCPGESLALPLLGQVLHTRLPCTADKPALLVAPPSPSLNVPIPHQVQVFKVLSGLVGQLQLLWELVLTAEPLVVMAGTPTTAANTVHALRSLIAPLKYSGDFRPFFTIHDSEFKEYTTRTTAPPNVMLGVTNPFFAKTLHHWPHVVHPVEEAVPSSPGKGKGGRKQLRSLDHKPGVYTKFKSHLQPDKNLSKVVLRGVQTGRPLEVQSALLRRHLLELTQSFMIPLERYVASLMPLHRNISPYKVGLCPLLHRNIFPYKVGVCPLLHRNIFPYKVGVCPLLHRNIFPYKVGVCPLLHCNISSYKVGLCPYCTVTSSLYKVGVCPLLHRNISSYKGTPSLRPFNPDEFLATLETAGPQLTSGIKGDWEGLYRRFFRCVNFSVWFNARYREISEKLTALHLQALSEADLESWMLNHGEVEKVDLILRVRHKLSAARTLSTVGEHTITKLEGQLDTLLASIPDDLRRVLVASHSDQRCSECHAHYSDAAGDCPSPEHHQRSPHKNESPSIGGGLSRPSDCGTVLSRPSDCGTVLSRSNEGSVILGSNLSRSDGDRRPLSDREETILRESLLNCSVDVAVKAEDYVGDDAGHESEDAGLDRYRKFAKTKAEKNALNTEQLDSDLLRSEEQDHFPQTEVPVTETIK
ncbi:hypothetical protein FHG87_012548 [Trinorchestia longiramus]|nr:hypothetical protein FHG87_012548 [Trinorchestia longiramus]